jgi:hypothetical protein
MQVQEDANAYSTLGGFVRRLGSVHVAQHLLDDRMAFLLQKVE